MAFCECWLWTAFSSRYAAYIDVASILRIDFVSILINYEVQMNEDNFALKNIENKIHLIRGRKVILDSDLAVFYGVETKALKQAVRRNMKRFPDDFMFTVTNQELKALRSQIVTLAGNKGPKYLPYAFTEQGIAMLSGILSSDRAIKMNIEIMRAFVNLRKIMISPPELFIKVKDLENKLSTHDHKIQSIIMQLKIWCYI